MSEPITSLLPFSRLFLAVLLHFAWQATLIVAVVAIGRCLIHPRFFHARYLLSVLGLFAVLIAPLLTAGFYLSNDAAMISLQSPITAAGPPPTEAIQSASFTSLLETQFKIVFNWFDRHRLFWLGCWLSGFVVLLVRLCVSLAHCCRLRRRQKPLPSHLVELAETLKRKLNLTRNIIVASSQEITQAVATGIIRPVVLVPTAWVAQLPIESLEAVLAHELAHLKRWDLWINLLQRFAETVFFFHPLVWWLSQQISNEREVCCDHLAIKITGQPMQYVETLAQVAGTATFGEFEFQFGTAFIGGKNMNLLRRAKMILEPSSIDAQSPFRTLALIACTGLMISYGSYAYCATPIAAKALFQDHHQDHDTAQHDNHPQDNKFIVRRGIPLSDQDGRFEVVVIEDDSEQGDNHAKLHQHLVELLHSQEPGNVDRQQLARQLRQLADRLEAEGAVGKRDQKVRRRVEVQRDSNHPVELWLESRGGDSPNRVIRVESIPGNKFVPKSDQPRQRVIELNKDERGNVEFHDNTNNRFTVRSGEHAPDSNMHSYRVLRAEEGSPHQDHESRYTDVASEPQKSDMHFGHATTSDGDLGQVLRELKNEVQQLRREVNQLRSNRDMPMDRSVRQRVQERQVQPKQRIEMKRFDGDEERPENDAPRTQRRVERESNNVDDGFGMEAKRGTFRFEVDSKTTPQNIWFEKETGDERDIQEIKIKPRLNQKDGNLELDVELSEDSPEKKKKK